MEFITKIISKIKYQLFKLYDNVFASFFVINIQNKFLQNINIDSRKISVSITSFHREKIIHKALKNIINDSRVSEIVILDDGSSEDSFLKTISIITSLGSSKIKIYRRDKNLGIMQTKIEAVSLCKNEWVVLLDSDNSICQSYLDSIYRIKEWRKNTIYSPEFAYPLSNFKKLNKSELNFENLKELFIKNKIMEMFLNCGNFFINKKIFVNTLNKYKFFNTHASDVLLINYVWLSEGNKICLLQKSKYLHRVHKDSTWKKSSDSSLNTSQKLCSRIIAKKRANFEELKEVIGLTGKSDCEIKQQPHLF